MHIVPRAAGWALAKHLCISMCFPHTLFRVCHEVRTFRNHCSTNSFSSAPTSGCLCIIFCFLSPSFSFVHRERLDPRSRKELKDSKGRGPSDSTQVHSPLTQVTMKRNTLLPPYYCPLVSGIPKLIVSHTEVPPLILTKEAIV